MNLDLVISLGGEGCWATDTDPPCKEEDHHHNPGHLQTYLGVGGGVLMLQGQQAAVVVEVVGDEDVQKEVAGVYRVDLFPYKLLD